MYFTVLLIQDTTHLNYSLQYQKEKIGSLIHNNYRDLLLHPIIAVTPQGFCLEVIDDYHWYRTSKTRHEKNSAIKKEYVPCLSLSVRNVSLFVFLNLVTHGVCRGINVKIANASLLQVPVVALILL
jgi:hypothetical protein